MGSVCTLLVCAYMHACVCVHACGGQLQVAFLRTPSMTFFETVSLLSVAWKVADQSSLASLQAIPMLGL